MPVHDDGSVEDEEDDDAEEVVVKDQDYDDPPVSPTSYGGYPRTEIFDDISPRVSSTKSIMIESEASADVFPVRFTSSSFAAIPVSQSESYGQVRTRTIDRISC